MTVLKISKLQGFILQTMQSMTGRPKISCYITVMKYAIYLIILSTLTKTDDFGTSAILGLHPHDKAATLVVKRIEFFSNKYLHEIRVKFPEERNVFVLDHQTHQ